MLEGRKVLQQQYVVATEARKSTNLQVAIEDYILATKTKNFVATQLLCRNKEGKSGLKF